MDIRCLNTLWLHYIYLLGYSYVKYEGTPPLNSPGYTVSSLCILL